MQGRGYTSMLVCVVQRVVMVPLHGGRCERVCTTYRASRRCLIACTPQTNVRRSTSQVWGTVLGWRQNGALEE
jgi:hypothetical protein